jgi:hypothetical protein
MLESLITSKPRIPLVKFFINPARIGHSHGLIQVMNESMKAVLKELIILCEAAYLKKEALQNRISYKVNIKHPLFATLQKNSFPTFGTRCFCFNAIGALG